MSQQIMETKKYPYIDALRGLAILGVISVHSALLCPIEVPILYWFALQGFLGVQLFFVASACTLSMSWHSRATQGVTFIRNFFIRRFFRIAPLFYTAIIVYSLGYYFARGYDNNPWWFIPLSVTFANGFHPKTIASAVPAGWPVTVEVIFYACVPLLMKYLPTKKTILIAIILWIPILILNQWLCLAIFEDIPCEQLYFFIKHNIFSQFPIFLTGIFTYYFLKTPFNKKRFLLIGGVLWIIIVAGLFISDYFGIINIDSFFYVRHIIAAFSFSILLIFLSLYPLKVIVNRITITLGKLSYSMYLTHFAVIKLFIYFSVKEYLNNSGTLYLISIILLTLLVSTFSYHCIEKPGILLGKKIITRNIHAK